MKLKYKILILLCGILIYLSSQIIFHVPFFSKKLELQLKSFYKFFIPVREIKDAPSEANQEILDILRSGNNTIYMIHTYIQNPVNMNKN